MPGGYGSQGVTYLRFDDKVAFNRQIRETMSRYLIDHARGSNLLWFQPIRDIHLKTDSDLRHGFLYPEKNGVLCKQALHSAL